MINMEECVALMRRDLGTRASVQMHVGQGSTLLDQVRRLHVSQFGSMDFSAMSTTRSHN